jgi:hypothetical protein
MSRFRRAAFGLLLLAAASSFAAAPADGRGTVRIDGAYLAVSYDLGRIYGEKAVVKLGPITIAAGILRMDVASGTGWALGGVSIETGSVSRTADALIFDRRSAEGLLVRYGEALAYEDLASGQEAGESARTPWLERTRPIEDLTLAAVRLSLLYATAKTLDIAENGEVTGTDVMMYVEGIESVGFKRFRLLSGEKGPARGFSLDKIWFSRTQGLFGRASFNWDGGKKLQSSTGLAYEEHSILKDYAGLPRQLDLQTTTRVGLNDNLGLGLFGSYNSSSLWNARVSLEPKWNEGRSGLVLDVAYNKPLLVRGETWLGLQSNLDLGGAGRLSVQGRYEVHDQTLANLSYAATLLKKVQVQLQSRYSRIQTGGIGPRSEIFDGNVHLAYVSETFQLGTDYALNYDLFAGQRLSRPQFRLSTSPYSFYGGLLTATAQNLFLSSAVKRGIHQTTSYSNNTSLSVAAKPILLLPGLRVQASLSLEQFLEKEGRNFTSGGLILRADRSFGPIVSVEGFYSVQSRRRSGGWLVEGTTGQDLSGVLRVTPFEALKGWVSVSYDPKRGEWRQSFADVTIGLFRGWRFQSLLNYDFSLGRVNNIDLFLVREAGRFDLRFVWRSISKQILVELVPSR